MIVRQPGVLFSIMKPQIKIKNLSVTYFKGKSNEVRALQNINLEIFPGEFVIFFGPSGCGKSTLMYSIAGLEKGIDGEIFIDEQNIKDMSTKQFEEYHQKKIGMIFQAYYLISSLSVAKNVMLPQIAIGGDKKERSEKADKLLKHFGVYEQKGKLPQELSGGQQQRVAICRSLINEPDIIFADEPVGNLDSKSSEDVMELLAKLNSEQKKTIILVTHDSRHLDLADRVFYLKDGKHEQTKANRKIFQPKRQLLPEEKESYEKLRQTYKKLDDVDDNVSLEYYKAKNIATEILIGLSVDEMEGIEQRIDQLLSSGSGNYDPIFSYLDKGNKQGGLDMDVRTAKKLTKKFGELSRIIHEFSKEVINPGEHAENVRQYLYTEFEIKSKNQKIDDLVNKVILKRLENDIDKDEFEKILDKAKSKGGAGFDSRLAHKMARRMELIMLGKYQLMMRQPSKKLELIDRKETDNQDES